MVKQHKQVMPSPRLGHLANMHSNSLTPAITKLLDDIDNIRKMKSEMFERVKEMLEDGISDFISQRYVDLSPISAKSSPVKSGLSPS